MPELLPMYAAEPRAAVEVVALLERDPGCRLCPNWERAKEPCLPADGEPGGVLLVGEAPGRQENLVGRVFIGPSGAFLRRLVTRNWSGPVAYDNALRCLPGQEVEAKHVAACRGYLARTVQEVKPARVVALGAWAAYAVLGRAVPVLSARRGWGWIASSPLEAWDACSPVPVFLVPHPAAALRNRFVMSAFESDLAWALTTAAPRPDHWGGIARVVLTPVDAEAACRELAAARWFAFDVETAGRMYDHDFRVLSLGACAAGSRDAWLWDAAALEGAATRAPLLKLLSDPTTRCGGSNVKYDCLALRAAYGITVPGVRFDTRLRRKLLDPEADGSLAVMAELVGMGGHKEEAEEAKRAGRRAFLREAKRPDGETERFGLPRSVEAAVRLDKSHLDAHEYALLPRDVLLRYNGRDAVSTAALEEHLERAFVGEPDLERTWRGHVLPASRAVEQVEAWGIAVSRRAVGAFQKHLAARLEEISGRFAAYPQLNPNSTHSVCKLLYETLGLLPPHSTDKGAPSTDREALEALDHPVARDVIDWREISKLKGTYADGMIEHIRADDRVHPNILLAGARSGRTSCQGPNIQNIPRPEDERSKMARDIFVAPPGHLLVSIDFSQIELRCAAMLSGDEVMRDIYVRGEDLHQRTAELIAPKLWGIKPSEVTKHHRTTAKCFNFGLLFGMSDETLALDLGCDAEEAAKVRAAIMGQFRKLDAWSRNQVRVVRATGHVWTWWNGHRARRRNLWRIADADGEQRSKAEHGAFNSPIQGTASDYCVASLTACVDWILRERVPAKLVAPIHDALLFEVAEAEVGRVAAEASRIMCSWPTLNGVPLAVDVEVGPSWGSMEKMTLEKPAAGESMILGAT